MLRTSGAASAPESATVPAGEERAQLIKSVYRETDLPDKPRNLIGMQSDIPTAEMEALLSKNVKVGPEVMRELALLRGLAVRDTLIAKGLASDRVFLGEPKLRVGDGSDANWSPQVKLTLDTK